MHIGRWWESQKERDLSEDLDVSGRITFRYISIRWGSMDWIDLAQNRDQ
jgi:hypothetical protein